MNNNFAKIYAPQRIIFYAHIEYIHRLVFDNLYNQDYKIKKVDRLLIFYYNCLFKIAPEFRPYLRYWKSIIKRAYNQKRINYINLYIYWKLKNINTERYSPYWD